MRFAKPRVTLSIIVILVAGFGSVGLSATMEFKPVFSFGNGKGSEGLTWVVEDGVIPHGPLFGPNAFATDEDGLFLIADSLEHRLLTCAPDGKIQAVLDLEPLKDAAGLASPPMVQDLALLGTDAIAITDGNSQKVLIMSRQGVLRSVISPGSAMKDGYRQVTRLQADNKGRIYVEDMSRMACFVFGPDGTPWPPLPKLVTFGLDGAGNLYQAIFTGDEFARDIRLHDGKQMTPTMLGKLVSDDRILFIRPLGADREGRIHFHFDTGTSSWFVAFDRAGKEVSRVETPFVDHGLDTSTPFWIGPDGTVYGVRATAETLQILRLQ